MSATLLALAQPFLLGLARVGGFFVTTPFLGSASVPMEIRAALALLTTLLLLPGIRSAAGVVPDSVLVFTLAIAFESLLGILLGFAVNLLVEGYRLTGEILGTQLGFGMISVLDPESLVEESLLDIFYFFIFLMIFLMLDFHHVMLLALGESFQAVPAGAIAYPAAFLDDLLGRSAAFFVISLQLSLPVVAPLLIVTVALGIVSKTVPRMEVFTLSFPIKIFLGFFLFVIFLPSLPGYTRQLLAEFADWLMKILPHLHA